MKVQRTRTLAVIAAIGALVGAALIVVPARATPPSPEVTTTPIGMGRFGDIDTNVKTDINPGTPTQFWRARIKTKRSSDLYVLQNTIPRARRSAGTATPAPAW